MALSSAEKSRARRERMKAQGLTQRAIFFPKDEPAPTQEEITALLERRRSLQPGQSQQSKRLEATEGEAAKAGETQATERQDSARPATPALDERPLIVTVTHQANDIDKERTAEISQAWEDMARQKLLEAASTEGKRRAKEADHSEERGRIRGICEAALWHIEQKHPEQARELLTAKGVTHETAEAALLPDRRRNSPTLDALEAAEVWSQPKTAAP
jgi:hypothetical protein